MPERATAAPFPATRWSVVLSARRGGASADSRAALEDLCRLYWRPLYAFARGSGCTAEDAEDFTQDFFARVIVGQDLFAAAEPFLGRLRTFLLTAFQHDLRDAHRAAHRHKRGSGKIVSFDAAIIEPEMAQALVTTAEPVRLFERSGPSPSFASASSISRRATATRGRASFSSRSVPLSAPVATAPPATTNSAPAPASPKPTPARPSPACARDSAKPSASTSPTRSTIPPKRRLMTNCSRCKTRCAREDRCLQQTVSIRSDERNSADVTTGPFSARRRRETHATATPGNGLRTPGHEQVCVWRKEHPALAFLRWTGSVIKHELL